MPLKRKAAVSTKAKSAAAIAAAESKEDETATKAKKAPSKCGRPKKKPSSPEPDKDEDNVEVIDGDTPDVCQMPINWKELELTWTMVTSIEEDPLMRASLFPPIGSIKQEGVKPKSDYQYRLAVILFSEHELYKDAFAKALIPKQKKAWFRKIKNRLKTYSTNGTIRVTEKTCEQIKEMGQTGAGIECVEDFQPGTELTNKWFLFKDTSPWFFHMRALIGEHPNLRPVGIGNNNSLVDTSLLLLEGDDGTSSPDDTTDLPDQLSNPRCRWRGLSRQR
ncbi:hypothetical protein B0H10DRAFT_1945654 [Mycena sp. CBHHK59/15]|nr:hypothetical protein B0H10DRAFT_1945654 [Mycena sp. CBHHK59/15]